MNSCDKSVDTVADALRFAADSLVLAGLANADQEARWIVEETLECAPGFLSLASSRVLTDPQRRRVRVVVGRRAAGWPLQYALGNAVFRDLRLAVGGGVLIPRPETEQLVDLALELCPATGSICDVCTGSGAIALALATELSGRRTLVAGDVEAAALFWARHNRDALGLHNVALFRGDLLSPVLRTPQFALVTANPPYVSPAAYDRLPAEVRDYEPRTALHAEDDGLAVWSRLIPQAFVRLLSGGWLVGEISSEQSTRVADMFARAGFACVNVHRDHSGRERFVTGRVV